MSPLAVILDFAGSGALQAVSECPLAALGCYSDMFSLKKLNVLGKSTKKNVFSKNILIVLSSIHEAVSQFSSYIMASKKPWP